MLMEVTRTPSVNLGSRWLSRDSVTLRLQAAIYFKNSVTKRWCLNCNETDPDNSAIVVAVPINPEEKAMIRGNIIQLLTSSEDAIARQYVESGSVVLPSALGLVQIGLEEYYIKWPTMMKELVACSSSNDVAIINRVLAIIEGICKVLETVPDNDIVILASSPET